MTWTYFLASLILLALGVVTDLLSVRSRSLRALPYVFATFASGGLLLVGVRAVLESPFSYSVSGLFGAGLGSLRFDALAGFFLVLPFSLSVVVSISFVAWSQRDTHLQHRGVASGYLLLLGSVAVIVLASNAFLFLFAWELLTLSFYILTSVTRSQRRQVAAAWTTVSVGKISGAALLFGLLLLSGRTGSFAFSTYHLVGAGALRDVAWVLVLVGFGAKLGLVPMQVWIPVGYPAAPGPARAAMAGIATNVGVYGLWRFFAMLGRPPIWLVVSVLIVGGFTALLGIAFAAVQSTLSRVIAYSSIENAGLIVAAYGVALTGAVTSSAPLIAVGLVAATLQTVTHAVAKSTLFVASTTIEEALGTDQLDELRGVGRRLPWSGTSFAVGALALAGLPPTVGFVSEWFILEALMQQFRVPQLALRLALAGAGAMIALTTGLAALTFLRLLGLTILSTSNDARKRVQDVGVVGRIGVGCLAGACLALAALSPLEIRLIARGLGPLVHKEVSLQALRSPWVLEPVFHGFSILSPSWLWIVMPLMGGLVTLVSIVLSRGRHFKVRRVPPWKSATSGVEGPSSYTPFGFANPLRHVLANILGTRHDVNVINVQLEGSTRVHRVGLETNTRVIEPFETYLYRPLRRGALRLARQAKRLQSGNLGHYVAYMLIALIAAIALAVGLR